MIGRRRERKEKDKGRAHNKEEDRSEGVFGFYFSLLFIQIFLLSFGWIKGGDDPRLVFDVQLAQFPLFHFFFYIFLIFLQDLQKNKNSNANLKLIIIRS